MSKKFGKFLLFTTVAGAAAYGAYHYLQTKDKTSSAEGEEDADDDFDDFSEDLDEDPDDKERSYVSLQLDKAEAIATEAFHKAKGVIADSVQQVKDTVKSVTESQPSSESNFTDLTALNKEKDTTETSSEEDSADDKSSAAPTAGSEAPVSEKSASKMEETVEEFFDDDL
ncbi:MAG: hypothetical protein HDQ97_00890 [Lachnospiraceae bacterium]|nr:hypothetical protein [Lachnospiraceae bacterium]